MRHLCLTVAESAPDSARNLARLIASLERQQARVDLVVVLRGGSATPPVRFGDLTVHQIASPLRISLSAARNLGMRHARETGLLAGADIVAFPDDDCAYPDGLLDRVERLVRGGGADLVAGCYAPAADAVDPRRFPLVPGPLRPALVMRTASSSTMFLTADAARRIGAFDESLGLGARYGASEDADYLLRALRLGLTGLYRPAEIVVLHPYKAHRAAEYYVGNVAVLAKHARGRGGTALLLARRLLGGVLLTIRAQLAPAELRRATVACRTLLTRPTTEPNHAC